MADISKVKLPDGNTYDIKDTTYSAGTGLSLSSTTFNHSNSVTAQTTQAVYPIKIDAQGHISAYGSAVTSMTPTSHTHSADDIKAGYLNIHPENSPTVIPFMHNDIAHLLKRGGSAVVTYDGTTQSVDISSVFDGSGSYWAINPSSVTTIIITLTLHKTFYYGNTIYVDFGNAGWRSTNVKIETGLSGTYTTRTTVTSNTLGHVYVNASTSSTGFNQLRFTFSGWATSTIFRIAQLGVYNYGSAGLRETYMSRGNDDYVFRSITPYATNTYALGASSYKWKNVYANAYNLATTSVGSASGWTTNTPTSVTKKTVVTAASGATASYSNGILTITNGSFTTGDSVSVTAGSAASLTVTSTTVATGGTT